MRIVLLGPDGQVGWELRRSLSVLGEVAALDRSNGGDLNNLQMLSGVIRDLEPDWIVNAAAYTAVDRAEGDPQVAETVNAKAPELLARLQAARGGGLIHYSTDYVFDGSGETPWREDDKTGPLNVYGVTKLAGEAAVAASGCRHFIFRTSWVYAARGGNFAKTMLRLASERETMSVVGDQYGAPTGAELIADVTVHAIRSFAESGIYHLVAGGETSWHDYARFVIEWARREGWPIRVALDAIASIASEDYPVPALRPLNSRLDTKKLETALGLTLPDWRIGVERMLRELPAPNGDGR